MNHALKTMLAAMATVGLLSGSASALIVPENNSQVEFFYVFGPDGQNTYGAGDHQIDLFIDVPENEAGDVIIGIYDADVGGMRDWRTANDNAWDTKTKFTLSGASELASKTFGEDAKANLSYVNFGPFKKTDGEKVAGGYRFKLNVLGVEGDDANLFKVKVEPTSASVFSYKFTFRLAPNEGDQMFFYPSVPAGTKELVVGNYDLDREGGSSILIDPVTKMTYKVNDSKTGEWTETRIPLNLSHNEHFDYVITKAFQRSGNAGLKFTNEKGDMIPVYFSKTARPARVAKPAKAPAPKKEVVQKEPDIKTCNTFTFDGRSSYDVDKQNLEFAWDFGDGNTSKEPVVTHTYAKGGMYNVGLTVTDNSGLQCDTASTMQSVYVNEAPKAAFSAAEAVCVGQTVDYNAGATVDNTPEKLSYMWDFGDGTKGEGVNVSKTYAKGGTYKTRLYVNDNDSTTCSQDAVEKTILVNTSPTASAGEDYNVCLATQDGAYSVTFDGGASADADGNALKYAWDFGDGTTGEGKTITHVYQKGGEYLARLTVSDGSVAACSAASDTVKVSLNRAPVAAAGEDRRVCVGGELAFDGSASKSETGELNYAWDFGDGNTATGAKAVHSYTKGGTYPVMLKVDNGTGTMCSTAMDKAVVQVNSAPAVAISDVGTSCVGDEVVFTADARDADNDKLKYMWDFGDGTTMEGGAKVTHKYAKGGNYQVSVVIDDGKGFSCSKASDTTLVRVNTAPVANAGPNLACCVDQTTMFDGSGSTDADGDKLSYNWSFGDGGSSTEAKTSHAYAKSGVYDVFLKVDDGSGTACSSSVSGFKATVNTKPVPVIKVK